MVLLRRSAPPRTLAPLALLLRAPPPASCSAGSTSCLRPHHLQRACKGSASGELFGEVGLGWLALPPGGRSLNKKLFDDRPLFLLTPRPPRRLGSLSAFGQKSNSVCSGSWGANGGESVSAWVSVVGSWLSLVRGCQCFGGGALVVVSALAYQSQATPSLGLHGPGLAKGSPGPSAPPTRKNFGFRRLAPPPKGGLAQRWQSVPVVGAEVGQLL